ncbi:MAG TPA: hypothetical protein PLU49_09665 [Saprospiraceae bacterium]|nr:hypothetical protein [Saprospiraceae bacterium]
MRINRNSSIAFQVILICFLAIGSLPSCSPKYGCPTEEIAKKDINEQLEKTKKGKSNLFSPAARKKMAKK